MSVIPVFSIDNGRALKVLEDDLVAALYVQRSLEERLLSYEPQASAPSELRKQYAKSKVNVQEIELKIRRIRHSF
jgi:hypothetical protein